MKKIIAIVVILATSISANYVFVYKSGLKKLDYELKDGETLSINSIINPNGVKRYFFITPTEKEALIKKKSVSLLNSAIIRSFDTDSNNVMDIVTYVNHISANRNIDYWNIRPYLYYAKSPNLSFRYSNVKPNIYDPTSEEDFFNTNISDARYAFFNTVTESYDWRKYEGFGNYYHKLFKSKTVRKLLFEQALEIVSSLCNSYPSDFKKSILLELDQLLLFTNSLKNGLNISNTDDLNDYWKGFIYRRYKFDNVPLLEIENSIIAAQSKIRLIDVTKNPDAMFEININNQVTLYYYVDKFVFSSKNSQKEIAFSYENTIDNLKYFKDDKGEYYQLNGFKNAIPISFLFDEKLVKVE